MEGLKKSFLVRGNNIVGFSDKNFSTCPIGTVLSFAGQTAPNGYLLCNGASYKVVDYPDLYAVIGNTYGGDTENFNVPNLVDKFIQGSTTSGEEKEAGLPNITGTFYHDPNVKLSLSGAFSYTGGSFINLQNDAANKNSGYVSFDASKSNPIYGNSTTVQPPALTMVYIIKAFHTNEGVDSGVSDDVIEYVASELKTSSNTDKTPIAYDAYMSSTTNESNFYIVRNGICYVYMDFTMAIDNPSDRGILLEKIPKPIGVINCQAVLYNNSTAPQGILVLNTDGTITAKYNLKLGERYLCNFSYPIA